MIHCSLREFLLRHVRTCAARSVALMHRGNPGAQEPSWMRRFELISIVVSVVALVRLVGTCMAEQIVTEHWVLNGVLSAASWCSVALQIRGRRLRKANR